MTQIPNLITLFSANNIIVFMLVFTRLTGLMQSAPFFSTLSAPIVAKTWFCALVAFILYPMVQANKNFMIPHNMPEFLVLIFMEFMIGYLIGFAANLLFEGVRMAGNIISIQTGLSMSEALDPATGVSSNILSRLYIYLTTLIFLATGAYQVLFMVINNSFQAIPIGQLTFANTTLVSGLLILFSQVFKIAFGVALPIFSVLLISDLLLGIMSKMMPQMNIYMVALPVKIYIGLFMFLAFLSAENVYIQGIIKNYMNAISTIFT